MTAPLNFVWQIPNLLATGGKPDTDAKFDWLIKEGFSCIISLEVIPDNISKRISKADISYALREVEEVADPPIEELSDFIASHIVDGRKVYIHCSAGANRSPKLARTYIAKQDLYVAKYLSKRANDLNHGDDYDWCRGHGAFSGDSLGKAITALENGLASEEEKVRFYSADTLIELMEHADHGCFDGESIERLRKLQKTACSTVIKLNPKYAKTYREIVSRFGRLKI